METCKGLYEFAQETYNFGDNDGPALTLEDMMQDLPTVGPTDFVGSRTTFWEEGPVVEIRHGNKLYGWCSNDCFERIANLTKDT